MSNELESLYREVILDHYKNPRGHGVIEGADVEAEGQNPLCGDEVSIFVSFDGDNIEDVKFRGLHPMIARRLQMSLRFLF